MTPWLILMAAAASACAPADAPKGNSMPTSIPPRDGNIAIHQELDAARRAGTLEAYDLFIARHPRHPLVATARQEREQIARRRPR
jgi:hypothetical protein